MPKAARLADIGAGHGCFPPTPIISGSGDVSINGRPAARKGDPLVPHACGNCPPHGRSISAGSATVSINGKPAARSSDSIGCGGSVSSGSGDTFFGDKGMGGALKSCMEEASASASPFVKVDFDAFPLPEEMQQVKDFTMAAYAGPEALAAHVKGQAQAMVGAQLQNMQSAAFGPALSSLGIDPGNMAMGTLQAVAGGAPLQNALVSQVSNLAGGQLTSHLSSVVQPQLAQALVGQATSAMQSGVVSPEALAGAMLPSAGSMLPGGADALGSAIGGAAQQVVAQGVSADAAAAALEPALSGITQEATQNAVGEFVGDFGEDGLT